MDENKATTQTDDGKVVNPLEIQLKKPITFEEVEYTSVDLSKIEDWSSDDIIAIKKKFKRLNGEFESQTEVLVPYTNDNYIKFISAEATGIPYDFFGKINGHDFETIRASILNFFLM